jgi:soluble lytic murein transglycosylase
LNVALQNQIAALPAIVRAHELFLSALRNLATLEWVQGLDALDADSRVQAIGLAASWGWYDQAVGTATKQSIFNDYALLYPLPYDAAVKVGTALSSLPPELIYGVIRQESLYRADAVSKADARGLMQLLPETAQRTARRIGRPLASTESLFDPMVNVPIASAHLRELVDRFGGQLPPAIAGYNAGPNAAARWLTDTPVDADIWIENIPYNETRTYVQRVQWHALVFAWRRSGDPQKLDSWIRPLSTTAADVSPTDELQ